MEYNGRPIWPRLDRNSAGLGELHPGNPDKAAAWIDDPALIEGSADPDECRDIVTPMARLVSIDPVDRTGRVPTSGKAESDRSALEGHPVLARKEPARDFVREPVMSDFQPPVPDRLEMPGYRGVAVRKGKARSGAAGSRHADRGQNENRRFHQFAGGE